MDIVAAMEEEFSGSSDQMTIVKRKRTKRSRQMSSLNAIVTSSSSSDGDGGGGGNEIRFLIQSNSMSSEISTTTEEDEDMANCLILLAQSGCSSTQQMDHQLEEVKIEKINSRKFTEMATTTGKAGIYVYECKTCNRSFPSFQALGGHRASHKKSKIAMVDEKKVSIISTSSSDHHHPDEQEQEEEKQREAKICSSPNNSIQLPTNITKVSSNNGNKKGAKVHECSICGSEFSSGQALGGHMRRHRNIPTSNKGNVNNIDTSTTTESSSHDVSERRRNILQLDLNLPAPVEDDQDHDHGHGQDSKFQFSTNQQKHVLFSSPAMVNCHY